MTSVNGLINSRWACGRPFDLSVEVLDGVTVVPVPCVHEASDDIAVYVQVERKYCTATSAASPLSKNQRSRARPTRRRSPHCRSYPTAKVPPPAADLQHDRAEREGGDLHKSRSVP